MNVKTKRFSNFYKKFCIRFAVAKARRRVLFMSFSALAVIHIMCFPLCHLSAELFLILKKLFENG